MGILFVYAPYVYWEMRAYQNVMTSCVNHCYLKYAARYRIRSFVFDDQNLLLLPSFYF